MVLLLSYRLQATAAAGVPGVRDQILTTALRFQVKKWNGIPISQAGEEIASVPIHPVQQQWSCLADWH